jgi:hypothetical protein
MVPPYTTSSMVVGAMRLSDSAVQLHVAASSVRYTFGGATVCCCFMNLFRLWCNLCSVAFFLFVTVTAACLQPLVVNFLV